MFKNIQAAFVCLVLCLLFLSAPLGAQDFLPGARTVVEAHNCYPYASFWRNRLDLALSCPFPVGVELDLLWHSSGNKGQGRVVVAHNGPASDRDFSLRQWFFDSVRSVVEEALQGDDREKWPLITLNLNDIRGQSRALFESVRSLIEEHADWFCSAVKGESPDPPASLEVAPLLVLSGGGALEKEYFYDSVPVGGRLRIFASGSIDRPSTNFRRWINYSWSAVEPEGQNLAGAWTEADAARLQALVGKAHAQGYWIRFYALNGHHPVATARNGWSPFYNFGSLEAVRQRWTAARDAGVDFMATDQCVEASSWLYP
ncbi:MAG: hypothetical protein GX130_02495 [Candidatus Hydrogenedens sp.]|nr:hypothetical protein [Candidatus Hydrogenedens sp.]